MHSPLSQYGGMLILVVKVQHGAEERPSPPTENGSRRSLASNFLWTQGNGRANGVETESALTVYGHSATL